MENNITKLADTAPLMESEDFRDRFRAEYYQLKIRINGLAGMIVKYKQGTLSFTPNTPCSIFEEQLDAMKKYAEALEKRAELENIDL